MTLPSPAAAALRGHPALHGMPEEIVAACDVFYGRRWAPLAFGDQTLDLRFEEVLAAQAGLQVRVRSAGHEFELQVLDPQGLGDGLSDALSPHVPDSLRRALVLHVLQPVWRALEQRLEAAVELLELGGPVPAFLPGEALGLHLSWRADHDGSVRHTAMLLRALRPSGWRRLTRGGQAARLLDLPAAHDPVLELCMQCEPVGVTLPELAGMAPGDVLLLDARADTLERLPVTLLLRGEALPVTAVRTGRWVEISGTSPALSPLAGACRPLRRRPDMPNTDIPRPADPDDAPTPGRDGGMDKLDALKVDIELELGRLSLPLSALRTLAVGQVFDTHQPIEGDGVVLWCGGQRLGMGQLVAIGDRLGVRIAALRESRPPAAADATAHDAPDAALAPRTAADFAVPAPVNG